MVPDARLDDRFADNPTVTGAPGIRFYAGIPLRDQDGRGLGTLFVIDTKPRSISTVQLAQLADIAGGVTAALELLRSAADLRASEEFARQLLDKRLDGAETAEAGSGRTGRWWQNLVRPVQPASEPGGGEDAAIQLTAVLESTTDNVIVLDAAWIITHLNRQTCELIDGGRNPVGASLWETIPELVGSVCSKPNCAGQPRRGCRWRSKRMCGPGARGWICAPIPRAPG